MKSGKYCIVFISKIKSPKSLKQINQVIIIMEENIIMEKNMFAFVIHACIHNLKFGKNTFQKRENLVII